jgi:hypothetical protein
MNWPRSTQSIESACSYNNQSALNAPNSEINSNFIESAEKFNKINSNLPMQKRHYKLNDGQPVDNNDPGPVFQY